MNLFFPTKHGSIPLLYLARVNKRGSVILVLLQEVDPFAANKHIWLYTIRCYWNPINAIFNEESPCVFLTYGHAKKLKGGTMVIAHYPKNSSYLHSCEVNPSAKQSNYMFVGSTPKQ